MCHDVQAAKQAASAVKEAVPAAPQEAAKDAASAVKAAVPDQPKQAAQDAASAVKAAVPDQPKQAAKDAASAVKAAVPDQPKQAAQDAASSAKESLPDAPKGIPNPFQSFFGGESWPANTCSDQTSSPRFLANSHRCMNGHSFTQQTSNDFDTATCWITPIRGPAKHPGTCSLVRHSIHAGRWSAVAPSCSCVSG